MDGHNLIFQVPQLRDLQVSGQRSEARRELETLLLAFANERQEEVVVVYDGNSQDGNPDLIQDKFLRTTYSLGFPDEVADHRILYLARQYGNHHKVSVVTSDIRTLARELDNSVTHLTVFEFWTQHIAPTSPPDSKEVTGDYSDIEAEFLRRDREGAAVPVHRPTASRPSSPPPLTRSRPASSAKPAHRPPVATRMEEARLKKERGRLRQQKRLKQYRGK